MPSLALALFSLFSIALSTSPTFAAPTSGQSCPDITVIFAKGTMEQSSIGTLVGPPLKSELTKVLPGKHITFTGVDYDNDIGGYLSGGSEEGSRTMAKMLDAAAAACPNTALVTSGYRLVLRLLFGSLGF
jgi:cutinase